MTRHPRCARQLTCALVSLSAWATASLAQTDGELDSSFGNGGKVAFDILAYKGITTTLVAPDGRLVVVGELHNPDGERTAFWTILDGDQPGLPCVTDSPENGLQFKPFDAAFDPAGRLVIAGSATRPGEVQQGFALRYLFPACELDDSFNLNGIFRTSESADSFEFGGVAFDSNSRVVLAGTRINSSSFYQTVVYRLLSTGLADFGFGGTGRVLLDHDPGTTYTILAALAVQPDDKIVIGGDTFDLLAGCWPFFTRLDEAGQPDDGFATGGTLQFELGLDVCVRLAGLAIDPETGRIVAAASTWNGLPNQVLALRLLPGGVLDPTFSDDGVWSVEGPDELQMTAMVLQTDSKIVVGGSHFIDDTLDFRIHRLTPGGDPDETFGDGGVSIFDLDLDPYVDEFLSGMTLHAGRPILAGAVFTENGFGVRAVVARLWSDLIFADGFERGTVGGW